MKEYVFENWKPINGFEDYEISDWGRVRNKYKKELKLSYNRDGYPRVKLYRNGRGKMEFIHRLVSTHFNNNQNGYKEVNHKTECKYFNHYSTLEWCDRQYNVDYSQKNKQSSIKVLQYTLDGEFIKEYPSLMEVQRQLGFYNARISEACKNNKPYHNFIWKYKDIKKDVA